MSYRGLYVMLGWGGVVLKSLNESFNSTRRSAWDKSDLHLDSSIDYDF